MSILENPPTVEADGMDMEDGRNISQFWCRVPPASGFKGAYGGI